MKRYIRSDLDSTTLTVSELIDTARSYKHSIIDINNNVIIVPFPPKTTEEDLMEPWTWISAAIRSGIDVSFEQGDFEYTTKPENDRYGIPKRWTSNKAYLRNRLIGTFRW